MGRIVSLKFEHDGQDHFCVVCIEKKADLTRHSFRIKTGELQSLLLQDNILVEKNGQIEVSISSEDIRASKLKLAIAKAIADYFKVHQDTL